MSEATSLPVPAQPVPIPPRDATPPPRFDFPAWMPAMLVKELRQGLRQRGFVGGMITAQAVLVVMFISGFVEDFGGGSARGMIDGIFWSTMFATLIAFGPLRALGGLSSELDARTMDLLLLTRLNAWRIVWGKWVSLMTQTLLLLVTLLPYAVVRYFFGSVDLVGDFEIIVTMLGAGAVFTAAGLWISGLHRALRLLAVIGGVILSVSMLGQIMSRHFMGMGGGIVSSSAGPVPLWLTWAIWLWCGALVLAYCLMMAVRWFAPQAENHAIAPRLLPLALLLPAPVLALAGYYDVAGGYVGAWLVVLAVVAAIELAGTREVMTVHLRGWPGRPGWRRVVGAGFLPGWPSASLWLAAMILLGVLLWGAASLISPHDLKFEAAPWLGALAWAGLVFPILLVALLPSIGRAAGILYFSLQGLLGIFAAMAGSDGLGRMAPTAMRVLDWISHAAPTTSFWHALVELNKPSSLPAVELAQALGLIFTLAFMFWLSRSYWMNVRLMREQADSARHAGK